MADRNTGKTGQDVKGESNSSSPEQPRSPGAKSTNSDLEYIMLAVPDIESDCGSAVSGSSVDKSKSQGSSVSSFADVLTPDMEATLEKGPTEEEVQHLVEDAKRDISHFSASQEEVFPSPGTGIDPQEGGQKPSENHDHVVNPLAVDGDSQTGDDNPSRDLVRQRSSSDGEANIGQTENVAGEAVRARSSTHPGHSDDETDDNAILFDGITYLGSSTVNAPVSEIELKRTMSILREQTEVTIDVLLYVGSTSESMIRLKEPGTQADIATYRIQRILFCGRGDAEGKERDCFAFNTVHGDSDIFHCHVFRCEDPDKVKGLQIISSVEVSEIIQVQLKQVV